MKADLHKVRRLLIASGYTEAILGPRGTIVRPGFRCSQDWYYTEARQRAVGMRRVYHGPIFIHSYALTEQPAELRMAQLERYAAVLRSSVSGFLKLPEPGCFYLELVAR